MRDGLDQDEVLHLGGSMVLQVAAMDARRLFSGFRGAQQWCNELIQFIRLLPQPQSSVESILDYADCVLDRLQTLFDSADCTRELRIWKALGAHTQLFRRSDERLLPLHAGIRDFELWFDRTIHDIIPFAEALVSFLEDCARHVGERKRLVELAVKIELALNTINAGLKQLGKPEWPDAEEASRAWLYLDLDTPFNRAAADILLRALDAHEPLNERLAFMLRHVRENCLGEKISLPAAIHSIGTIFGEDELPAILESDPLLQELLQGAPSPALRSLRRGWFRRLRLLARAAP